MFEQRHNTHALSSYNSSSDNHSYNNENNKKKKRRSILSDDIIKKNEQIYNNNMNKINAILSKYNIILNLSTNPPEKKISKKKKIILNNDDVSSKTIKKKRNLQIKNENTLSASNSIINAKSSSNNKIVIINKDKTAKKIEEQKNNDNNSYNKLNEALNQNNNSKNDFLLYRKSTKETRFNNIQKNLIDEENKIKQKKKFNSKNKLLFYQQENNSRHLLRSIKKSEISFITKESKILYMSSELKYNVKNNICFYTKKIIKPEEFIQFEKKIKKEKYEKLKNEVLPEEEKIPTFSSIDSSSSNNTLTKIKSKGKSKSKLKSKKKKTHIKQKQKIPQKKKKLVLPKYTNINRPIRSISLRSKFSSESNRTQKTNNLNSKIPKRTNERKYSIISRLQDMNKKEIRKNIISSKDLRKKEENKTPFKNNLLDINKPTEENAQDKDKENREKDFKKFLDEQNKKKKNQILKFIKKQGMNSYNYFYPKEPSPLLSLFKNKYSVYPTLNINRRSSLDNIKKNFYSATYRNDKKNIKKLMEEKAMIKIHIKEKHYGNEKDCPICRSKKEKDELLNNIDIKSMKYNRFKIFSPLIQNGTNKLMREFEPITKNRINSAKVDLIGVNPPLRRNFSVLLDYFMQ